jgi:dihydroorotase
VLLRAMQYAKTFGYTVWLRPQDAHIGRGGVAASVRWRRAWACPACR